RLGEREHLHPRNVRSDGASSAVRRSSLSLDHAAGRDAGAIAPAQYRGDRRRADALRGVLALPGASVLARARLLLRLRTARGSAALPLAARAEESFPAH